MTEPNPPDVPDPGHATTEGSGRGPLMAVTWLWVGVPFGYGLYELGLKLKLLFTG